jgi:hypothetical protein
VGLRHDPELLAVLDGWIHVVPDAAFTAVLPLLRRAFSAVPAGERRRLGMHLRAGVTTRPADDDAGYDVARAAPALATVARLLGVGDG